MQFLNKAKFDCLIFTGIKKIFIKLIQTKILKIFFENFCGQIVVRSVSIVVAAVAISKSVFIFFEHFYGLINIAREQPWARPIKTHLHNSVLWGQRAGLGLVLILLKAVRARKVPKVQRTIIAPRNGHIIFIAHDWIDHCILCFFIFINFKANFGLRDTILNWSIIFISKIFTRRL